MSHPLPRMHPLARATALVALPLATLILAGCVPEPVDNATPAENTPGTSPSTAPATTPAQAPEAEASPTVEPLMQAEDCGWDVPALSSGAAAPAGQSGDLETVIVGAWQHTHFDTGAGFEAIDGKDIRYVFPSADRLLYCQHVPGITDHAQNATDITWEDTRIVVPTGAPGWVVTDWDANSMQWLNLMDNSVYLLQRR